MPARAVLIAIVVFATATAAADEPRRIAVFPLLSRGAINVRLVNDVQDAVGEIAGRYPGLSVIQRAELRTALKEKPRKALLRCGTELPCLSKLGTKAAADEIVIGRAEKDGPNLAVTLLVVDIHTGEVIRHAKIEIKRGQKPLEVVETAAVEIFGAAAPPPPAQPIAEADSATADSARPDDAATDDGPETVTRPTGSGGPTTGEMAAAAAEMDAELAVTDTGVAVASAQTAAAGAQTAAADSETADSETTDSAQTTATDEPDTSAAETIEVVSGDIVAADEATNHTRRGYSAFVSREKTQIPWLRYGGISVATLGAGAVGFGAYSAAKGSAIRDSILRDGSISQQQAVIRAGRANELTKQGNIFLAVGGGLLAAGTAIICLDLLLLGEDD